MCGPWFCLYSFLRVASRWRSAGESCGAGSLLLDLTVQTSAFFSVKSRPTESQLRVERSGEQKLEQAELSLNTIKADNLALQSV